MGFGLLALCILVDCLLQLLVLFVALPTSSQLLVFDASGVLILLLLIDLPRFKVDFLQLEHIEDVKNRVDLLVRAHGDPLLETLCVCLQLFLNVVS